MPRPTFPRIGALLALLILSAAPAAAQCQEWSPGFHAPGLPGLISDVKVLDDGAGPALFVLGAFPSAGAIHVNGLARWNGSRWSSSFDDALHLRVGALERLDLGGGPAFFGAGRSGSPGALVVGRWTGSSWTVLGPTFTGNYPYVNALAAFDDGSGPALYAAGDFQVVGSTPANRIARWNGTAWSALGSGVDAPIQRLIAFDDGSGRALYALGYFTIAGGVPAQRIARWNGLAWSAVGTMPASTLRDALVFDDGTGPALYACGGGGAAPASTVLRWNGTGWLAVGVPPGEVATGLAVHDGATGPALCGQFAARGSQGEEIALVARWDGTSWHTIGRPFTTRNGPARPGKLCTFDAGQGSELIAAGEFTRAGGTAATNLARWDGASWGALGGGQGIGGQVRCSAVHDDGAGPALYVGGWIATAGDRVVKSVARWNGTGWSAVGDDLEAMVSALASHDDGSGRALFAASNFGISKWNGTAWSSTTAAFSGASATALAVYDSGSGPELFALGALTSPTLQLGGVLRWDGAQWSALPIPPIGLQRALLAHDDGSGPALYLAGSGGVARWNGASWSPVGGPITPPECLAVHDDGTGPRLYAGGMNGVQCWNGTAWEALPSSSSVVSMNLIHSLVSHHDESGPALYAGGRLSGNLVPGVAPRIARWDGTTWSSLALGIGEPIDTSEAVYTLASFDDGSGHGPDLYAAGWFDDASAFPSRSFARWSDCPLPHVKPDPPPIAPVPTGVPFCFGDGTATPCPCANTGAHGRGCGHSHDAGGAFLEASGTPSVSTDSLRLVVARATHGESAIFLQGTQQENGGLGVARFDGLACLAGTVVRLGTKFTASGSAVLPEAFDAPLSVLGALPMAGGVRHYQAHYRDPAASFCPPAMANWTNGLTLLWMP